MIFSVMYQEGLSIQEKVLVLVFSLVIFFVSLSIHELAHGFVAYKFGDDTAKLEGRLTLNPLKHIDANGLFWFLILGVGWAKPVPVNPLKFKKYRTGMRWVSIAGVLANFLIGLLAAIVGAILLATVGLSNEAMYYVYLFLQYTMFINSALALFNLLPIYPLDGFNFVTTFMKTENKYIKFNMKYGYRLLLGIILISMLLELIPFFGINLFDWYLSLFNDWIYMPIFFLGGL